MRRSFFTICLGIFLINIRAFASLSPHPDTHEPFDLFRASIVQISQIARWIDPSIHSILNSELQSMDKARKKILYTKKDYVYLIQKVSGTFPDTNFIFRDILSITDSIVHNSILTLIPLDHTQMDLALSPGFSHGHINPLQQIALENVHDLASSLPSLVQVADIGAGHGFASQHFLLAGTHHASAPHIDGSALRGVRVTAIEQHVPLLKQASGYGPLMHTFGRAKKLSTLYAQSGARVRDYFSVIQADAASLFVQERFQNSFHLCYLGNMLHYCVPKQAQCVVKGTYDALQPGARAYASVHVGFSFPQLELSKGDPFKIYEQQYTAGKKFPGWMMLNNMTPIKNEIAGESFHRQAHPLDEDTDAFSPVQQKAGWHNIATTANKAKGEDGSLWLMSHQSFQIYDAISLKGLFESNGFLIDDLFFEAGTNTRIEISQVGNGAGRFTSANDAQKVARVCIVARKPSLSLPFNTTCSTTF